MGLTQSAEEEGAAPAPAPGARSTSSAEGAPSAAAPCECQSAVEGAAPAAVASEAPSSAPAGGGAAASVSEKSQDMESSRSLLSRRGGRHNTLNFREFLRDTSGSVFDSYEKVGDLGEGAFGDVWLARERVRASTDHETAGRQVAVKRVRKPNSEVGLDEEGADSEEAIVDFRTEVDLMKSLDHPSICRLLQVFEDAKNIFLVMEHIKGGELLQRLMAMGSLSEHDAAHITRQVASALAYCHEHGVVHRDIKPENILIVDPEDDDAGAAEEGLTVKVIDFGFGCRILRGAKLKAKVGTFMYTAPEALKGQECDEKIDMWALGCVLYILLCGNCPFGGKNTKRDIMEGVFSCDGEGWEGVSEAAKDLVRGLLVVDPGKRLTAAEVHSHPWLSLEDHHETQKKAVVLKALDNIKAFHNQSCFRHLCTGVLARQLDESRLHELHNTFASLDQDENGILSLSEFKGAWGDFGLEVPPEMEQLFTDVDMDGSGEIDYTEFVAACLDRKTKSEEDCCWATFRVFDLDGDGMVTHEELHKVVRSASVCDAFPQSTLDKLWLELTGEELGEHPPTREGTVDFDHFLAALGNVSMPAPRAEEAAPVPAPPVSEGAGLPIAKRLRGTNSLPIPSRGSSAAPTGAGLPIVGRHSGPPAGGGLPIKSRGSAPAVGGGGLPIASRHH